MVCPAFHKSQELFLYTYLENHKKKIWLKSHKIQFFVHYRAKFLPDFCRQKAIKTGKFADCRQKEKTGKMLILTEHTDFKTAARFVELAGLRNNLGPK